MGRATRDQGHPGVAAALLSGDDSALTEAEQALASWARQVVRDPNGTTTNDLEPLRRAGYDDAQIVAISTFVALRMAFSSVNDALGLSPDPQLGETVPTQVREAVTWGRPIADGI